MMIDTFYVYTSPGGASDSDWWHDLPALEGPPTTDADELFDRILREAETVYKKAGEWVNDDPPTWHALPRLRRPNVAYIRVHFHKGAATVISQIDLDPNHPCRLVVRAFVELLQPTRIQVFTD